MSHLLKIIILGAVISIPILACWFVPGDYFDNNYIVGVNNYQHHHTGGVTNIYSSMYYNNVTSDLPITVLAKVTKFGPGGFVNSPLVAAELQYRVLPNGKWIRVKRFDPIVWNEQFERADFFGRNNIMPDNVKSGDVIMIRMWLSNGFVTSGNLDSLVSTNGLPDVAMYQGGINHTGEYDGGWTAPFVMTVIYSGNTRAIK